MSKIPGNLQNHEKGSLQNMLVQIRLILQLMGDRCISGWIKIIPLAGLIYLFSPIDLIPDITLPVIGYLDDVLVIWLIMKLFVALCPNEVVREHLMAIQKGSSSAGEKIHPQEESDEIIDAEYKEL
jgi:uncharacterized membrane protein YkvA (DUF1232 family)